MSSPRVLISGDVCGRLSALFRRVATVSKSNGPFDVLFCVGQFFPEDALGVGEMQEYIEGKKEIPLPTYFIGNYGEGSSMLLPISKGKAAQTGTSEIPVCHNLVWLKDSGIVEIQGLRIAYLGGKFSASVYQDARAAESAGAHHEDDVDALRALAEDKAVTDLFLSNEWPQGVVVGVDLAAVPPGIDKSVGAVATAELAADLKPRYHFAGTEGVFYAREPYLNPGAAHATRFIALALVGNDKKQKFLHALSPTPASVLASSELALRPPNLTVSPYEFAAVGATGTKNGRFQQGTGRDGSGNRAELELDNQYWRYDTSGSKRKRDGSKGKVSDSRRRQSGGNSTETETLPVGLCFDFFNTGNCGRGTQCRFSHSRDNPAPRPPARPSRPCWFCLSSPEVSTHLVVSIGSHCYCALAKGAILPGHVLLLPIEHIPSTIALSDDAVDEIQKYKRALRECYESQGSTIVAFERYTQLREGTHAHLQVMPIPLLKALGAREAFVSAAKQEGFRFQEIPGGQSYEESRRSLKEIVQGRNYIFIELSDDSLLVHSLEPGAKMGLQFCREVLANILGKPDRGDWKACAIDKAEEEIMTNEFKQQFSSFDPMQ